MYFKTLIAHLITEKKNFFPLTIRYDAYLLPLISEKDNIKYGVKISALPRNLSRLEFQRLPVTIYYRMTFSET